MLLCSLIQHKLVVGVLHPVGGIHLMWSLVGMEEIIPEIVCLMLKDDVISKVVIMYCVHLIFLKTCLFWLIVCFLYVPRLVESLCSLKKSQHGRWWQLCPYCRNYLSVTLRNLECTVVLVTRCQRLVMFQIAYPNV